MELDLLTGLIPRQQILLKRPDLAKVLTLAVDRKSYWISDSACSSCSFLMECRSTENGLVEPL